MQGKYDRAEEDRIEIEGPGQPGSGNTSQAACPATNLKYITCNGCFKTPAQFWE
ncbi:hypothetical protein KDH_40760 [Dictyobacter sp. S3.2.2.5]|uniref:Uncharacterized protein n=1 Tax=Dictyobacter halimunensis TaxID=3026934 RepID=A0ABQ6FXX7_9CHLR|nr:hypothetical protein KDH_40760 [Dictyobacter sp. S3.2.2.5]